MRMKFHILLPILVVGLLIAFGAQAAFGQTIRDPRLRANPNRTPGAGGACVYDREGQVVFAPAGKHCPDRTDHLSRSRGANRPVVASYPPAMQAELSKLLGDHDHIAEEISRLRNALKTGNQRTALEVVDKISAEIRQHKVREERFFQKMAPPPASP